MSKKSGHTYGLPTEIEWEYAARGGRKSKGFNYSGSEYAGQVGWLFSHEDKKTHDVGRKRPNELGIHDMTGNIEEMIAEGVVRGGSYASTPETTTVSFRALRTDILSLSDFLGDGLRIGC